MNKPIEHFFCLDLLRFLAALIVVIGHVKAATFVEFIDLIESDQSLIVAAVFGFARLGDEAVLFFFVLSGFLVGGRAIERMIQGSFILFHPLIFLDFFSRSVLLYFCNKLSESNRRDKN